VINVKYPDIAKLFGDVHLDRHEATALLKELIGAGFTEPSFVVLKENRRGAFDLVMKDDYDLEKIQAFISDKNLVVNVDKTKGYCTICRP